MKNIGFNQSINYLGFLFRVASTRIGGFGMKFTDDVLICGGVDINKRPLLTCDILKRKSYWEFDVSKLEESRTNAATAPSPYKDWFVTGGFVGVHDFTFRKVKD